MHYDPSVKIIAETKFGGEVYPWIKDVIMPVAWKKCMEKEKSSLFPLDMTQMNLWFIKMVGSC